MFCICIVVVDPWLYTSVKTHHAVYLKRVNLLWPVWHHPVDQTVAGSIPSQGTYPGCRFSPQSGHIRESNQLMFLSHINVFLSLSLSPLSSLKAVRKCSQVRGEKVNFIVYNLYLHKLYFQKEKTGSSWVCSLQSMTFQKSNQLVTFENKILNKDPTFLKK